MHALFLAAALATQPSPAPLKTIVNLRSREICTVLRENLAPAIGGVLANDSIVGAGQTVMDRLASDAQGENASLLGGEGAGAAMDNWRIENDVNGLVANIEKIEKLLDGATYRGKDPADAAALDAVRSRLSRVLAIQKAELNVLSFVAYSNQGRDLQAMKAPTGSAHDPPPATMQADMTPATLPRQLYAARGLERRSEDELTAALTPMIAACR